MNHPSFPSSTHTLSGHVQKTVDFAVQISIRDISTVLAPLAREDALARCINRHRGDRRLADEGKLDLFIQPRATTSTRREQLVLEWGIDDADNGPVVKDEGNRHTKHGEAVGIVDGACQASILSLHCIIARVRISPTIQGINAPGRVFIDQTLAGLPSGIRLLSEESTNISQIILVIIIAN